MLIKVAEVMGLVSVGGLIAIAQIPAVDVSKLESWPVTALIALVALVALSILFYSVRQLFSTIRDFATQLGRSADATQELCARLNVRPCLKDDKK